MTCLVDSLLIKMVVTLLDTIKSLKAFFKKSLWGFFFLKNGIPSVMVYTKKVPNIPDPLRDLPTKQVIVVYKKLH